jgi:mono/diheme cytochrome c family protein
VERRDAVRLLVLPALLLIGVSGLVFGLANWHPAKTEATVAAGEVKLGDPTRGKSLFVAECSGCHGVNAQGGVGPRLAGASLTLARVKAQIDNGGGTMPAGLVTGEHEEDVLAYLQTILAPGSS